MKVTKFLRVVLTFLSAIMLFESCDSQGLDEKYDIVGTWYGTSSYYNPVSGTKFRHLTIEFWEDFTGELQFEGPTNFKVAYFKWSVSNGIIQCNGASANIEGDVDADFSLSLRIDGDRLIPQNQYGYFILTRDGSVETNSDGDEIVDKSEMLKRVWITTVGDIVLNLKSDDTFEEYVLESPYSDKYLSVSKGSYTYDSRYDRLMINGVSFDITLLDEESLMISGNGKLIAYNAASPSDIPSQPDLHGMLVEHRIWSSENSKYKFVFSYNGKDIAYLEKSNVKVGSYGIVPMTAQGTYTLSGNKLTCNFTSVYWEGGNLSQYADIFPGWTYNKPCTKIFTIESNGDESIIVTDEKGNRIYMNPT